MINFSNSYSELPDRFYARLNPTSVCEPGLVKVNRELAGELGIDPGFLESDEGIRILSGNSVPDGASPLAMVYAGHQFGGWVPRLGDGRAILLGEVIDRVGIRRDIQLKGCGRTPFSRSGDGRAWLGPVMREFLVSEAMHHLGIPSTRALAAVVTGEPVYREGAFPGAVLTRVAKGHIRVGTFQYFYSRNDTEALRILADHTIARLHPEVEDMPNPILGLLERVVEMQARLIASWMGVGFIHGVMNTDNVSLACETIDFGPCAFMDSFHPSKGLQFHRPWRPLRLFESTVGLPLEPGPVCDRAGADPRVRPGGGGQGCHPSDKQLPGLLHGCLAYGVPEETRPPAEWRG